MMNSQTGAFKQSNVERLMNIFTVVIFIAQLALTLSLAILGGFWHAEATAIQEKVTGQDSSLHHYIEFSFSSMVEGLFTFVRYF